MRKFRLRQANFGEIKVPVGVDPSITREDIRVSHCGEENSDSRRRIISRGIYTSVTSFTEVSASENRDNKTRVS